MRRIMLGLSLAAFIVLAGCDYDDWRDSQRVKEPISSTHPMKPGGRLYLETFNGSVEVLGWEKDSVEIVGEKYAATKELLDQLKIDVSAQPDLVRIRVIRPTERRGNAGARFTVRVPRKTVIDRVETSNGSLRAENLDGPVRLRSSNGSARIYQVNGDIDIETSNAAIEISQLDGDARLKTSNGRIKADEIRGGFEADTSNAGIEVQLAAPDPGRPIRLDSSNGSINLTLDSWKNNDIYADTSNASINVRLPAGINARIKADTSNGSISSDFDLNITQKSKTYLEGTLGSGGASFHFDTSNGNIRLLKR